MELIGIFNGNPTAGQKDGAEVSQNQIATNAAGGVISANAAAMIQKLAVRCQDNYEAANGVTISVFTYENGSYVAGNTYLKLAKTEDAVSWSSSISFDEVDDTNSIFYIKVEPMSTAGTVLGGLRVQGTVTAVV